LSDEPNGYWDDNDVFHPTRRKVKRLYRIPTEYDEAMKIAKEQHGISKQKQMESILDFYFQNQPLQGARGGYYPAFEKNLLKLAPRNQQLVLATTEQIIDAFQRCGAQDRPDTRERYLKKAQARKILHQLDSHVRFLMGNEYNETWAVTSLPIEHEIIQEEVEKLVEKAREQKKAPIVRTEEALGIAAKSRQVDFEKMKQAEQELERITRIVPLLKCPHLQPDGTCKVDGSSCHEPDEPKFCSTYQGPTARAKRGE
jgi:hypothetical protein